MRNWWELLGVPDVEQTRQEELVGLPHMAQAIHEVGMYGLAHLMRRMQDPACDVKAKDRIALALVPKLVLEFRGRITPPADPGSEGGDTQGAAKSGADVMARYA